MKYKVGDKGWYNFCPGDGLKCEIVAIRKGPLSFLFGKYKVKLISLGCDVWANEAELTIEEEG